MPRKRHHGWWIAATALVVVSCAVSQQHDGATTPSDSSRTPAGQHRTTSQPRQHVAKEHVTGHLARHPSQRITSRGDRATTSAKPTERSQPVRSTTRRRILTALSHTRVLASRPFPGGYDRDCGPSHGCVFGPAWTDDTTAPDGHNGCDTRNDVLREQLRHPVVEPGTHDCKVIGGTFDDPYTGRTFDFAVHHQTIQIDHLVPLAYAWDMGASRWSQVRREQFANDTRVELLASWGPANESKGDSGPGDWLPINTTFRCTYLARYLHAIDVYGLAMTRADASSIRYTARGC
ncbi:HNH endonuclease family protein [Nocardioides terrisoli]|uniref:HNH endonuclease family protein n=1 Tax=Nocardioides terrisoli TaxID=3388267 RepID=UPI00287BAB2B|nr:HNH endonuclease family protein [Nocardioides marmorisolisilvae]